MPAFAERNIELATVSTRELAQGCGMLVDAVDNRRLAHVGQELLRVSIEGSKPRKVGESWVLAQKSDQVDISPLKACVLALFVLERVRSNPTKKRSGVVFL